MRYGEPAKPDGISVKSMTIGVMILVAWLCWAIAAAKYLDPIIAMQGHSVGNMGGGRIEFLIRGIFGNFINFIGNSLMLHHAPGIITNTLRHERWIILMLFVLEGLAFGFGMFTRNLEDRLQPPRKRKRKRRPITGPRDEPRKRKREGI